MSERILVTGGTGVLGRAVIDRLLGVGCAVRTMSRRARPPRDSTRVELARADLRTGDGLDAAVAGVDAIVHCATAFAREREPHFARALTDAAWRAGSPHLVYVSIVGVDRVDLPYYREKLAAERVIEASGVPYTILRATQFHDLIRAIFSRAAHFPVMPVPAFRLQPVDTGEVAGRLAELAQQRPVRRVRDFGGPQVRQADDLAQDYLRATGRRRPVLPVRMPGAVFVAYRRGHHLAPSDAAGTITFDEYLAAHEDPGATTYRGHR